MRLSVIRPSLTPKWWIIFNRSSRPGAPFGIFEKSSLPIVFWPSSRKAQWSVEIADSTSVRTASQSTGWFDLSRTGGEKTYLAPPKSGSSRSVMSVKKYCVQVSPQTAQFWSRAVRIGVDGVLAGDVDDVERSARDAGQLDRPVRRLAFELGRTGQRVVAGRGVPGGERLAHEHVDCVAVLGVHHHERARLGGDLHRPEERLVVDHQRALVGHEQLVRGDALRRGASRAPRACRRR